jgi:hypothetical protein
VDREAGLGELGPDVGLQVVGEVMGLGHRHVAGDRQVPVDEPLGAGPAGAEGVEIGVLPGVLTDDL